MRRSTRVARRPAAAPVLGVESGADADAQAEAGAGAEPVAATRTWSCRVTDPDGRLLRLLRVHSDRVGADEVTIVDGDAFETEVAADVRTRVGFDGGRVVELWVSPAIAAGAQDLWWVEVREEAASPPAVHLVGFAGHGRRPAALLDEAAFADTGVRSDEQRVAVRWYPATGEIDQVYVQPEHRRHTLGYAAVRAAGALSRARGWPPPWGDGQRTAMGEAWRNASSWKHRAADLTVLLPPMTPAAAD